MLALEGHALNHNKLYRVYHEERLMVRRRRGRKRALGTRAQMKCLDRALDTSLGWVRVVRSGTQNAYSSRDGPCTTNRDGALI
jgi:hypothetical protein